MRRAGLSQGAVVDLAMTVVDDHGIEGLTLAEIASRAGVATPSLYKHVRSVAALRVLVGTRVLEEMTDRFAGAVMGRGGDDAVDALMREYRAYGTTHPNRYLAMPVDALHHAEHAEAGERLMGVFLAVLRAYDLDGSAAVHAIRSLRTVAHGFVTIEIAGGFGLPEKLDETFDRLIAMVIADLHRTGDST